MKLRPCRRTDRAFTRIELAGVILLLLVLGALWAAKLARQEARNARIKCVGNLKNTGLAFKVFANDHDDKFPFLATNSLGFGEVTEAWLHFQAMSNECGSAKILICPADRERLNFQKSDFTSGPMGLPSAGNLAVGFGIGLEADEALPNAILLLDRNLVTNAMNLQGRLFLSSAMIPPPEWDRQQHKLVGNAALADGSVQQLTGAGLARQTTQALANTGHATNHVLLPLVP